MERQPSGSPNEIYRVSIQCRPPNNKQEVQAQDRYIIEEGCGVPHYPQETCWKLVFSRIHEEKFLLWLLLMRGQVF